MRVSPGGKTGPALGSRNRRPKAVDSTWGGGPDSLAGAGWCPGDKACELRLLTHQRRHHQPSPTCQQCPGQTHVTCTWLCLSQGHRPPILPARPVRVGTRAGVPRRGGHARTARVRARSGWLCVPSSGDAAAGCRGSAHSVLMATLCTAAYLLDFIFKGHFRFPETRGGRSGSEGPTCRGRAAQRLPLRGRS